MEREQEHETRDAKEIEKHKEADQGVNTESSE